MRETLVEFKSHPTLGAILPADAFSEMRARLWGALRVVALEAPQTIASVVVVTDFYRDGDPGYHGKLWAFDVRAVSREATARGGIQAGNREQAIEIGKAWRTRVALRLGSDFDVVFGDPEHLDHLHVELDQRKVERSFEP